MLLPLPLIFAPSAAMESVTPEGMVAVAESARSPLMWIVVTEGSAAWSSSALASVLSAEEAEPSLASSPFVPSTQSSVSETGAWGARSMVTASPLGAAASASLPEAVPFSAGVATLDVESFSSATAPGVCPSAPCPSVPCELVPAPAAGSGVVSAAVGASPSPMPSAYAMPLVGVIERASRAVRPSVAIRCRSLCEFFIGVRLLSQLDKSPPLQTNRSHDITSPQITKGFL